MRRVSYSHDDHWKAGFLIGENIVDARTAAELAQWPQESCLAAASNRALCGLAPEALSKLENFAQGNLDQLAKRGAVIGLSHATLGPPIWDPEKIICIGLNYHDHAEEVGAPAPDEPIFFAKYANSLIGPDALIVPPKETQKIDYEVELAVVIGQAGRCIPAEKAEEHIAGAMVFNDVSARDLQLTNQLWTGGKAVDTFGPCGPALVAKSEIGDLHKLALKTRVNGTIVQDGTTASMIFSVGEIIAFLSRIMTLVPGDIIATGTPAGVGVSKTPPGFLKTGDVVEVEIEKIGCLKNTIAEPYR